MQQKASALIAILEDALRQIERNSKNRLDDPEVIQLKHCMHMGIVELEAVRSASTPMRAA